MNRRLVFPNNQLFYLQFIIFPLIIIFICHQIGLTVDGVVFNSIVIISDEYISGPGTEINLFPVKLPLIDSECTLENRRTGKFRCECLIIRNKNKRGEICLPNVYFTYDLFDEITNLIRITNEQKQN